jgi:hypothetical protein
MENKFSSVEKYENCVISFSGHALTTDEDFSPRVIIEHLTHAFSWRHFSLLAFLSL